MKNIMNKKGNSVQMIMLMLFQVLIGVMIIVGMTNVISYAAESTTEEIVANDLVQSIQVVSSSPGVLHYRYPLPDDLYVEVSRIDTESAEGVRENAVIVLGPTESASADFNSIAGVSLEDSAIIDANSLPIILEGNTIKFEVDGDEEYSFDICNDMPGFIRDTTFRFSEYVNENRESAELFVDEIERRAEFETTSLRTESDVDIYIGFHVKDNKNLIINNPHTDEEIARKITCYLSTSLRNEHAEKFSALQQSQSQEDYVEILLPESIDPAQYGSIADSIVNGVEEGL